MTPNPLNADVPYVGAGRGTARRRLATIRRAEPVEAFPCPR